MKTEEMCALPASPEELLISIRSFVKGTHARSGHKLSSEEHARCALHLLRTLPAARTAVLEHLCHVFDESVNSYLFELEGEASTGLNLDGVIQDINEVLSNFIDTNAEAWAPFISAWSIDLLGQISSTYAGRRGVPHPSSLNELLQLWMTCKATRTLMDVASQCFAAMVGTCPDLCVDALLDTSVQHSPHFDWVVAHIGSCFPNTIITRVLSCGLKDFCNSQSQGLVASDKKVPKMASVVGILGHLAAQHSQDIRKALLELFQESLESDEEQHLFTVPFLLQLATMSPMLLRVITTDFVQALTPEVLNRLSEQFFKSSVLLQDKDSLLTLVIHLICRSGSGAFKLLCFLLDRACNGGESTEVNEHVQNTCALILDLLVLDLQRSVYSQTGNLSLAQQTGSTMQEATQIPFLSELQKYTNTLCAGILTANDYRLPWLQRLLGLIGVHCGESCSTDILTYVLIRQSSTSKVGLFTSLQAQIEATFPNVLVKTVNKTMNQLQRIEEPETYQLLVNITHLVKWETVGEGRDIARSKFTKALTPHLHSLSTQLHHSDLLIATQTMELLYLIGRPEPVTMVTLVRVAQSAAEFYFTAMLIKSNTLNRRYILRNCQSYLSMWCRIPMGQQLILRTLMEGLTNRQNCALFGGKPCVDGEIIPLRDKPTSLLRDNQKFANASFTLPASNSAVFHAGTIGRGLKPQDVRPKTSKDEVLWNCQFFLNTIYSCCGFQDQTTLRPSPSQSSVTSKKVEDKAAKMLSTMLVELACPDVTHVGLTWPEEEHMKVTVERDLCVRRRFDENPLLWDILEMVSRVPPAMCQCTVILYSLQATLISFWMSSREEKGRNAPSQLQASCRLLECLNQSGFLPPPLCYCSLLFPSLAPSEIYLLLTTVWACLKENPPSATAVTKKDVNGRNSMSFPPGVIEKYTEVVHAVVHKNISQFGELYSQLFPAMLSTMGQSLTPAVQSLTQAGQGMTTGAAGQAPQPEPTQGVVSST
ncbi:integrator complex subunit 5-like [Asterias amurensis]|uniref:integrator complex subunit 5-like n=1 Tax=Asterias amurensis TaxID=7602 RepID=UPI003AB1BD46